MAAETASETNVRTDRSIHTWWHRMRLSDRLTRLFALMYGDDYLAMMYSSHRGPHETAVEADLSDRHDQGALTEHC